MCGRTACSLTPDNLCKACSYFGKDGFFHMAKWKDARDNMQYKPNYNMTPNQMTPVVVSESFFEYDAEAGARIITPMFWGFIPKYHTGTPTDHGFSTINCRVETIQTSPLYSSAFRSGHRCIILTNGYYEWLRKGSNKQPYFIHLPQPQGVTWHDESTWDISWTKEKGWQGPTLLPVAGIFSMWLSPEGKRLFNYSLVTMDATDDVSSIHDRQPIILDTENKIDAWLTKGKMPLDELLQLVKQPAKLEKYTVNPAVGRVTLSSKVCMVPWDPKKASGNLANWLIRDPDHKVEKNINNGKTCTKRECITVNEKPSKRMKTEVTDKKDTQNKMSLQSTSLKGMNKRLLSDDKEEVHKKLKDEIAEKESKSSLRIFLH